MLVAQIEFLEWTGESHFRHTKFIALRDDKAACTGEVRKPIARRPQAPHQFEVLEPSRKLSSCAVPYPVVRVQEIVLRVNQG